MIDRLTSITQLTFPIVTAKRYDWLSETSSELIFDDIRVVKMGNLYKTFNLAVASLPETYEMFPNPETLLRWVLTHKLKGKVLIDDNLNIFIPQKLITINYETRDLINFDGNLGILQVKGISYFLPITKAKVANTQPLIATTEKLWFHIDWSNVGIRYERTF